MDTKAFLSKILPTNGFLLLAKWLAYDEPKNGQDGTTIYRPYGPEQYDEMADEALRQSAKGENVYYACSSFKEITYKDDWKGKDEGRDHPKWWGKVGRTQANVQACKAFWLDLDVRKPKGPSYGSQKDAANALALLCKTLGLPLPMIVSSGNGLHCYWVLTKEIPADKWKRVARHLAAACDHVGVLHDSSCTTDESRILRPVGIVNPKGNNVVTLKRDADPMDVMEFASKVINYSKANSLQLPKETSKPTKPAGIAGAILEEIEYPPSSAYIVADHCNVVAHFRDVLGNVDEPLWWVLAGFFKHTVEGEALFHEWSSGDDRYDEGLTQAKLDAWTYGPPGCEKIKSVAGKLCDGCKAGCKNPIQLGHSISESEVADTTAVAASTPTAPVIPFRPSGFRWTGQALVQEVPDKDGVVHDVVFSDTLFYAINRVRDENNEWNLRVRMSVAGHEWREFDMPTSMIADPRGFAKHMAKYEVLIFNIEPARLYMKEITKLLMQHQQKTVTYDRFGWDEGKFIVGKTAYLPDGTTQEVLVTDNIVNAQKAITCAPKGNLNSWVDIIDSTYNRPGAEMYQFVLAAYGFASPLVWLADFKNFRGIPIVLSGEGGIGKSSVFKAANTIYADPNALMIDASTKGGTTLNGLLGMASLFNGVPLLFDELTEREDSDFTPIMYSLSNGVGKVRMTSNGKFAENVKPYAGNYGGTSNSPITDKIYAEEKKDTADAANARCFEIGGLTKQGMIDLFGQLDIGFIDRLGDHHGVAAQVYLPYISTHRDSIRNQLIKVREKLGTGKAVESRERYYIDLIAFAYVAATIAKNLGLIKWDVAGMTKWALGHMKSLRRSFAERTALTSDVSGLFLSWLHGSIIVTKHFPQGRPRSGELEVPQEPLRGKPQARIALVDKKMFVSVAALQEWCKEYNQDYVQVRAKLKEDSYVLLEKRESIGKGTNVHAGQLRCFEFNYDKVVGNLHSVKNASDGGDETAVAVAHAVA